MNNNLYKKLLWGTGFVIVAVILTLFIMSQTYIQNLVYHERLNQMEEVTHQMFRSLEDVIDTHWDEVNVQCNYLFCAVGELRLLLQLLGSDAALQFYGTGVRQSDG